MPESLPTGPPWNIDRALRGVDDCESDLRDLIEVFLQQMPLLLSNIRSALENQDCPNLQLAAHTLKGSLQILCADAACLVAANLEIAGKTGQSADGLKLLSQLETELASVTEHITKFLEMP